MSPLFTGGKGAIIVQTTSDNAAQIEAAIKAYGYHGRYHICIVTTPVNAVFVFDRDGRTCYCDQSAITHIVATEA